jgi:hypothetical protein
MISKSESEKSGPTEICQEKSTHSFVAYLVWWAWESLELPKREILSELREAKEM